MDTVTIEAEVRDQFGKRSSHNYRREQLIPGVLYGGKENVHFVAPHSSFKSLIFTSEFKAVELSVNGKTHKAIMKAAQYHPLTDNLLHIDLVELVDGKKVLAEIPVSFVGTAAGEREGGKLTRKVRKLKIRTTPDKLMKALEIDVSELNLGDSIRVRDIKVEEDIEVLNPPAIPLASVEIPRALKSATAAEEGEALAEGEEGATPEGDAPAEGGGDTPEAS